MPSPIPVEGVDSIRERIMCYIETAMRNMKKNENGYRIQFDGPVERADLGQLAKGKKYALSIFDEVENKTDDVQVKRCELSVNFEFLAYIEKDEKVTTVLNKMANDIERKFLEDETCGGIAINCTVLRIEYDNEYLFEKNARGTMFTIINYRHRQDDPRFIV